MTEYIKAERPHFIKWLEQKESTLVDALLMLNGVYCNQPASVSSITHLFKLLDDEKANSKDKNYRLEDNLISAKIKTVIDFIGQNRLITPKRSNFFAERDARDLQIQQIKDLRESKVFLETTIMPPYFVSRLWEYTNMIPFELQAAFEIFTQGSAIPNPKPIDPREEKTLFKIIYSIVKKHYKYDPNASKNADTSKIMRLVQNEGFDISHATVKRILDKAFKLAEEELSQK